MENLERTVKAKIARRVEASLADPNISEDEAYCIAYNNWHLKLPGNMHEKTLREYDVMDSPLAEGGERTCEQFYQDRDLLIDELGLDLDKMKELQLTAEQDIMKRRELYELAFPLYIRLLEIGYTITELIS